MKLLTKSLVWVCAFLLLVVALAICSTARRVILTAKADLTVDSYPNPDATRYPPIATLAPGEKVAVIGCDDLKSYMAVHIQLTDGREGYVIDPKYQLNFYAVWTDIPSPISLSC